MRNADGVIAVAGEWVTKAENDLLNATYTLTLGTRWGQGGVMKSGLAGGNPANACTQAFLKKCDERSAVVGIFGLGYVGLPIADTVTLMVRRALRGRSRFSADREHLMFYLYLAGLVAHGAAAEMLCRRLGLRQPAR